MSSWKGLGEPQRSALGTQLDLCKTFFLWRGKADNKPKMPGMLSPQ